MLRPEASVSIVNGISKLGSVSTGWVVMAFFRISIALVVGAFHVKESFLIKSVRGEAKEA